MISSFTPTTTALVLVIASALAVARLSYRHLRAYPAQRSHAWRIALLLLAQPACAALLYFALWPPTMPGEAGTLVIATAGAQRAQTGTGETMVALPEAPMWSDVERAPDLASAWRRHPGTQRVRVIGAGLDARDRDAASRIAVEFTVPPPPRGLIELQRPERVGAGDLFRIAGRAGNLAGGSVELLDPASRRVDHAAIPADGRFTLSATARVAGSVTFRLRLIDARQRVVEESDVPLQVDAPPAPRVLLLAGAPGPEVKYLRRWLEDAGAALHSQMSVGGGVQLGDTPVVLNAENLARFDIVIADERAWSSLGDAQRAVLDASVRGGLGLLLRVTGPLSPNERTRLRALGFSIDAGRESTPARLPAATRDDAAERARIGPGTQDAPRAHDEAPAQILVLNRRDNRLLAGDGVPLLRDAEGAPLGVWRAHGRGRAGVLLLTDSFRLVLGGRGDLHAQLWSGALSTLARPRTQAVFDVDADAWQDQRMALCGVGEDAIVVAPDGRTHALLRDRATGTRACAAFWPRVAGWHLLRSGDASQAFFVRARDAAPALRAQALREATLALAAASHIPAGSDEAPRHPGARWPWWLAWLLASAVLWWFERSRAGRRLSAA